MTFGRQDTTSPFSRWLQHNSVVILTVLGILLYTTFDLPAVYFYGRLGTSPNEVGLTYSTVLSGAPIGIVVAILAFIVVGGFIIGAAVDLATVVCLVRVAIGFSLRPGLLAEDSKLNLEQFLTKLKIGRRAWMGSKDSWRTFEQTLSRRRELMMLDNPTPADRAQLRQYRHIGRLWVISISPLGRLSPSWKISRRRYPWAVISSVLLAILATLFLANTEAEAVLHGKGYIGAQIGLLDYRADKVTIMSISPSASDSLEQLTGKTVFLLGQTAQYVVIYAPSSHHTIRIPIGVITVSDSP